MAPVGVPSPKKQLKKVRRRKQIGFTILVTSALLVINIAVLTTRWVETDGEQINSERVEPRTIIVDEAGAGIPTEIKQYVYELEQSMIFSDLIMARVTFPARLQRGLYVHFAGIDYHFIVSLDRQAEATAEDILEVMGRGLDIKEYVDLRLAGRAYYR